MENFLPALKAAGITELHQLDSRIETIDDAQLAKFQAALNKWLTETNNVSWSTNQFDIAKIAFLMTAPPEVAKEILKAWPFNSVLTAKIKQELGIEEAADEPKVCA